MATAPGRDLIQALQLRVLQRGKTRALRLRKPPRQFAPRGIERDYRIDIVGFVIRWWSSIEQNILPRLPEILSEAGTYRPELPRRDQSAAELIAQLIVATRGNMETVVREQEIQNVAQRTAIAISAFNREQVNRVFRSVLGIDLIGSEPYLRDEVNSFIAENVGLITTIRDEFLNRVEEVVYRSAREGVRVEELRARLQEQFGKSRARAELIARDQTNKFNGQLTQLRQKNAGVEKYIWRTARDERVRPEHRAREGKTFSWNNPPYDGHPGQPIQCRCIAEPVLEGLI